MAEGFFVSCTDAGKTGLLLGPFRDEKLCREYAYSEPCDGGNQDKNRDVINACHDIDPKSHFYCFGMVRIKEKAETRTSVLTRNFPEWENRFNWHEMIIIEERVLS